MNKKDNSKIENLVSKTEIKNFLTNLKEVFLFIWDIGKTLFFVVLIAFIIRFYLIQPFYVEGQSMEPSFNNGEYLLIDEISYHFREPRRGEVIVFRPPISTYQNYIKRIIALPGEEIDFNSEGSGFIIKNQTYPDGIMIEEKYLSPGIETRGDKDTKISDRSFFVMGDNRTASSDSRIFGPVFKKNITGRVWFYIKLETWKTFNLFNKTISIPKIKSMGNFIKPDYKIDQ